VGGGRSVRRAKGQQPPPAGGENNTEKKPRNKSRVKGRGPSTVKREEQNAGLEWLSLLGRKSRRGSQRLGHIKGRNAAVEKK